jgi:predicted amidohydrolase
MTKPDRVRVAAAQYPIDPVSTFAAWQAKTSAWIAEGAATRAELLVFPEYGLLELAATRGSTVPGDVAATLDAAAGLQPEAEAHFVALGRQYSIHILAPSGPVREGNALINRVSLITPAGAVGRQGKQLLTPFEQAWRIAPAQGLSVFETALGRIGIAICYDSEFPLLVRALAEAGADIVLVPSCTEYASGYHRVRAAAAARALESQIATVLSPMVGDAQWCAAVGQSHGAAAVFVPPEAELSMSGVIVEGHADEPCWVTGDIDLAALAKVRETGEVGNARDWSRQPGAAPLGSLARVVPLA